MKRKWLILLLLLPMLFSGCTDQELETRVIVVCMGLDIMPDGQIELSVQISDAAREDKAGGGAMDSEKDPNRQDGYIIMSARGNDWVDAFAMMRAVSTHILNFTQVRAIVFSRELSETDRFFDLIEQIYLVPQMRSNAYVLVTMGEAKAFLQSIKPEIGTKLSKYLDIVVADMNAKGYIPKSVIGELARDARSAGATGRAPVVMLAAVKDKEQEGAPQMPEGNPHNVMPDRITGTAIGDARFLGAAITDGKKVVGYLTGYEMQLLNMLGGSTANMLCQTSAGNAVFHLQKKPSLAVRHGNPDVLVVSASVYSYTEPGRADAVSEVSAILRKDITALIEKMQQFGTDVFGFGQKAIIGFDTIARWEAYGWRNHFQTAQIEVSVEVIPMLSIL